MSPQMADNSNGRSKAAVAVGARVERSRVRWVLKSLLTPLTLLNLKSNEFLFIGRDASLDQATPGSSILGKCFPRVGVNIAPFESNFEGVLVPQTRSTTRALARV